MNHLDLSSPFPVPGKGCVSQIFPSPEMNLTLLRFSRMQILLLWHCRHYPRFFVQGVQPQGTSLALRDRPAPVCQFHPSPSTVLGLVQLMLILSTEFCIRATRAETCHAMLCRTVPYCAMPCLAQPSHTVPLCAAPNRAELHHSACYCAVPFRAVPHRTALPRTLPYRAVPCHSHGTVWSHAVEPRAALTRTIPSRTVPNQVGMVTVPCHSTAPSRQVRDRTEPCRLAAYRIEPCRTSYQSKPSRPAPYHPRPFQTFPNPAVPHGHHLLFPSRVSPSAAASAAQGGAAWRWRRSYGVCPPLPRSLPPSLLPCRAGGGAGAGVSAAGMGRWRGRRRGSCPWRRC